MATERPGADAPDLQPLLQILTALKDGDFRHKLPEGEAGTLGEIAATVNALVDHLNLFAAELTRLSREIGPEGVLGGQMELPQAAGTWRDLVQNVNLMSAQVTDQLRNFVQVTTYYADGDFSRRATVECRGETRELKEAINGIGQRLHPK